ncbi:MAG TPA: hypothetical protein VFI28_12595 [Candidatus Limnocylindrales bacterium]|nr:hypothetical protein [Candidatus Limnocylindrales bacterium]
MAAREVRAADVGPTLPLFERLAPPPPIAPLAARIEALTAAGDVVVDLHGRGGWVARTAIDRQRRALSIEMEPLTRLLAELVLRPPDLRHLDAAFTAVGTAPRGETSVRAWIADRWSTRCPTCERVVVLDELVWEQPSVEPDGLPEPVRRTFRCPVCRDEHGGGETRHAPSDEADRARARDPLDDAAAAAVRDRLLERFPVPPPDDESADPARLPRDLLDLHTPRQLAGLAAILDRIETDLRAAPVVAALRIAFVHAVLPASRLHGYPGRVGALRVANGRIRPAHASAWRERNPWLAFEDGYRLVRAFIQRIESAPLPPVQARYVPDVRALVEGGGTVAVRLATASAYRALADEGQALAASGARDHVRLIVAEPPPRPTLERLALAYHATAWALGREAAELVSYRPLFDGGARGAWSSRAAALRGSLAAAEPLLARDGRVVVVTEPGAEALVAAAVAGAAARFRVVDVRPLPGGASPGTLVELVPPGGLLPPGPRTRANIGLQPIPGGLGDADLVPSARLFGAPEPIDARAFSTADAARTITATAVRTLRARGEPAPLDSLLGEIVLGLDRAGTLRRYVASGDDAAPVEGLLSLIRDELGRATNRQVTQVSPGHWWLADREDVESAEPPLADRLEWTTYSLLSTAGPLSEATFRERIEALFRGPDLPDRDLVEACLASYRSAASTPNRLVTNDDLQARTHEHAELLGLVADTGHRLGFGVWISAREQTRRLGGRRLADLLEPAERTADLRGVVDGRVEAVADVDAIWYARGRLALMFEIEWTAMIGEPLLRRHARMGADGQLVRFLVVPPERVELLRLKLERSALLRAALEGQNWHVLKWNHLRAFAALDEPSLDALEPFLGLDPPIERSARQLPLFVADPASAG